MLWVLTGQREEKKMRMRIEKRLTSINFTDKNSTARIKYIVIHYFGSLGTAEAVANYFKTAYRGASAHYSLDEGDVVYQSVEDGDIAWHCGTSGKYYHATCRNSNSLGIEVRPFKKDKTSLKASDTDWYFTEKTVDNLVEFTKMLMKKYNIPAANVIRHYDVTHKTCPNPFVVNAAAKREWDKFKARLVDAPTKTGDFKVRVTTAALNIRAGVGSTHRITGVIRDRGVYTIVATQDGWGKLKSGAGWISLSYTTRV